MISDEENLIITSTDKKVSKFFTSKTLNNYANRKLDER